MERLTDKNHNAVNRCGEYSSCYSCNREKCYISELADKLGEFEDFMEGNKFESIENLQNAINGKFENIFDETHKIWIKIVEDKNNLQQEYETIKKSQASTHNTLMQINEEFEKSKKRWEALKKFIKIHFIKSNEACEISSLFSRDREILKMVLDKINDLEVE